MREIRPLFNLAAAALLAAALVVCTLVYARTLVRVKSKDELIHVDGSARKPIHSDFIIWSGSLSQSGATIAQTPSGGGALRRIRSCARRRCGAR